MHNITCCLKCENRKPKCHSSCETYLEQKAIHNAKVEKERKEKELNRCINIGDFSYAVYRSHRKQ